MAGVQDLPDDALTIVALESAETIPSSWYTEAAVAEIESGAVFERLWQFVGHERQVERPGDYLSTDVVDDPVVIVRDGEGRLRAFYNVCRHRGGPLATDSCGHATMLQCKYHGWTYRLDGSLRGVPRFGRSDLFDKRDYGLVPIELATWEGLVFVRLEPGGPTLGETLAGVRERIAPAQLADLSFFRQDLFEVACNWKVYVDNFLEGYHIPLVHPELCDVLDVGAYETETFKHYSLQHSPLRDGDDRYGDGEAFYYFVFPNVMLNILPGRLQVNRVIPDGPGACRVLFDTYYADVKSDEAQRRIEADLAFSEVVQKEDIGICEHVQRGLRSRGYDRGRFSPECEQGVYHFQCMLKEAFRAEDGRR